MKFFQLIFYGVCIAFPLQSFHAAETLSQENVVAVVLKENPTLKAMRAKWEMMKARVPQAKAWEDLRLDVDSLVARPVDVPPESFMDQTVTLEQELPVSGKNRSRARAATAEAGSGFEEFRRVELDLVSRAKAAYFKLSGAYAQLEINDRNQELLKQMVKISSAKYEAGMQSQADVFLAQTDLARLLETRAEIERDISAQQTQLNVLMNRPARTPLARPAPPVFKVRDIQSASLETEALASRPEISIARSKVEAEKARLQLARRQWIADPTVNVKAQRYNEARQPVSEWDVGVSLPLPWLNHAKYAAGIVEAEKRLESAQREYEAARNEVFGLVRDQVKKIETIAENYRLYHNKIVPLANEAVQSTRISYEADKRSFLELITARRTQQDVDLSALNYLTNYQVALAELEAMVGAGNLMPAPANRKTSK